ncbi:hypothetical protein V7156_28575, partial [Priestia megaterium]
LMIITVFGSITFRTIQINGLAHLKKEYVMPIIVETRSDNLKIDTEELTKKVEELPNVKSVGNISSQSTARLLTSENNTGVNYSVIDIKRLQQQGLLEQFPYNKKTTSNNRVVLSKKFAEKNNLKLGQTIHLGLYVQDHDITNGPVYKLHIIKDELQKHRDAFSKEQLEELETAMKGFDYSLDTQLKTIRSYKNIVNNPYTSNNYGYEEEEKYNGARMYLTDFESNLGVAKPEY